MLWKGNRVSELLIEHLSIESITPNPWNPNVQNEAQYKAEIESIVSNGFIAPILVRKVGKGYQIVDGEHRHRALSQIINEKLTGAGNVPDLIAKKQIPAVVLDVDDAHAKKLTIVMNETRGRADMARLGALLSEIKLELGDDLKIGLPYTAVQLNELMDMGAFDWSELDIPVDDFELDNDDQSGNYKIAALLEPETGLRWKALLAEYKAELPKDAKLAAGAMIARLIEKSY